MTEPEAVAGRIEIEPQQTAVGVPEAVLHEIRSHALEAVPEECCGLVLGTPSGAAGSGRARFQQVYRCRNVMERMHQEDPMAYPRTNRDAFYIDPGEIQKALADADGSGLEVTAIYHSHVDAPAYFSEMDQAYATQAFPTADQIVVSVLARQVRGVGLFRPGPDGALAGHPVESLGS